MIVSRSALAFNFDFILLALCVAVGVAIGAAPPEVSRLVRANELGRGGLYQRVGTHVGAWVACFLGAASPEVSRWGPRAHEAADAWLG